MKKQWRRKAVSLALTCAILGSWCVSASASESAESNSDLAIINSQLDISQFAQTADAVALEMTPLDEAAVLSEEGMSFEFVDGADESAPDSPQTAPRAALPDLQITNLRPENSSEPFPNFTDITFAMDIKNIGSASAANVSLDIYSDDVYMGRGSIAAAFSAGAYGTLRYTVSNNYGAIHKLRFDIVCSNPESSTANNSVSRSFRWQDCVSLDVRNLSSANGVTIFSTMQDLELDFVATNHGTLPAYDVPCVLTTSAGDGIIFSLPEMPAKTAVQFSMSTFHFRRSSVDRSSVVLTIDPNSETADNYRYDNSTSTCFMINPDITCAKSYNAQAENLQVHITPEALEMFDASTENAKLAAVSTAIKKWNGIKTTVSIATPSIGQAFTGVLIGVDDISAYTTLALTNPYQNWQLIHDPTIVAGYDYVQIIFNRPVNGDPGFAPHPLSDGKYFGLAEQQQALTHELGHALGLTHPREMNDPINGSCLDPSVMRPQWDSLFSYNVEAHDKYNIRLKY